MLSLLNRIGFLLENCGFIFIFQSISNKEILLYIIFVCDYVNEGTEYCGYDVTTTLFLIIQNPR